MTKDDIIRMAREAGPLTQGPFEEWCKRFAAFVAVHKAEVITAEAYRCGYEAGAAAEREECAKLCEAGVNSDKYPSLTDCAAAIRAKSQT